MAPGKCSAWKRSKSKGASAVAVAAAWLLLLLLPPLLRGGSASLTPGGAGGGVVVLAIRAADDGVSAGPGKACAAFDLGGVRRRVCDAMGDSVCVHLCVSVDMFHGGVSCVGCG